MSSVKMDRERPTVVRLLRETIVQLCRANAPFGGGRVEIDGIICITGSGSGQELVVKVHEVLHDAVDQARTGPRYTALFDHERYLSAVDQSTPADGGGAGGVDIKRRRLDVAASYDSLAAMSLPPPAPALPPHQSALYDYLSRFGLPSSPRIGADLDTRLGVKDLSLKSGSSSRSSVTGRQSMTVAETGASPARRPPSPVDAASDACDRDRHLSQSRPVRPVLSLFAERWSPNRPIPAIPQCFVCGYRFSSAESLGEHNETVHSIFTCLCCFKTFTSRSNLERHSRLHTGHRPYACPVCGKTFSRKDHLSNHATKHAFKCGMCTRRCADQSALADHYRIEHPGLTLAAVCAYCNKGFSSVELYEEHVKVHPQFHVSATAGTGGELNGEPSGAAPAVRHQCQMCGFEAMDRVCLVQHQQLMHYAPMSLLRDAYDASPTTSALPLLDRQSYRCVVCGFNATTLLALRQHEAAHVYDASSRSHSTYEQCAGKLTGPSLHQNNNDIEKQEVSTDSCVCRHCGQQFATYSSLCQHIEELSHLGDETFLGSGQHRDKRKQKQPKPLLTADAEDEDEEVNVVSPDSVDDKKSDDEQFVEGRLCDRELKHSFSSSTANDVAAEIRMEPIRSIMNRSSILAVKMRDHRTAESPSPPALGQVCSEAMSEADSGSTPPQLMRRENGSIQADNRSPSLRDLSGNSMADLQLEHSPSLHSSPDDLAVNNNNITDGKDVAAVKYENQWISSSSLMVEQTRCIVCGSECADFAEMESHCLSEHSRSPCMYCPKTFAQKANRDRHMCLHTGDRPYGCPECGERFARGDKLKMHRVRTHGVLYPLYGSRGGGGGQRADRERDASSRNHSTSQSPMPFDGSDCSVGGTNAAAVAAVLNGGSSCQDTDVPQSTDSELRSSTSVMSGGEWIDLRISMCRESSKLQTALAGIASAAGQALDSFPKREITDDEISEGQQV